MFDIGFSEVVLVGLVALLVFGPERLPKLVREVAFWMRKAKRAVDSAKAEINRELELDELRRTLSTGQNGKIELLDGPSKGPTAEGPGHEPT